MFSLHDFRKYYPDKFKGKDYYQLAQDLSRAIIQFGQSMIGMQFIDEYKMDFLNY